MELLTFDQVGDLLDEIAGQFPPAFYRELNGGISLLPRSKRDTRVPGGTLYILGEYCNDQMGRYINLYYGSFAALGRQEGWTAAEWKKELYATLSHEFTHHMEGLAGERGLEIKDAQYLEELQSRTHKAE